MSGQINNEALSTEIVDDAIIVHGDIDMAGSPVLEGAIIQQESAGHRVVIDLADVFFIDSSGLRCLLAASRRGQTNGATVILRSVGHEVRRLLEITGTTELFDIQSNRE